MPGTKNRLFLPAWLIIILLLLSGCGGASDPSGGAASTADDKPDSVRIATDPASSDQKPPVLTLTNSALVLQLYATTFALPQMPQNVVCTLERGPHYTLTFLRNNKPLATALAKRDGCHPVTITGEKQDRQATSAFWSQLDQAIQKATPATSGQ
jgi:hypothetical protein